MKLGLGFLFAICLIAFLDVGAPEITGRSAIAREPVAEKKPQRRNKAPRKKRAAAAGSFSGTVTVQGRLPKPGFPAGFREPVDRFCKAHRDKITDRSFIVDPKTRGLRDVFVFAYRPRNLKARTAPGKPFPVTIKNCTFDPPAALLRVGQKVVFTNNDPTPHGVHTFPYNPATSPFNKILRPNPRQRRPGAAAVKETLQYRGEERMPVKVVCDLHPWMVTYQLPLEHDFAALTDKAGRFKITGLPAGNYTFRIWHARAGFLEKSLRLTIIPGAAVSRRLVYKTTDFGR